MTNYPYTPGPQSDPYAGGAQPYVPPFHGQAPYPQQPPAWPPSNQAVPYYGYGQPPAPKKRTEPWIIWLIVACVVGPIVLALAPVLITSKMTSDFGQSIDAMTGGQTQQILDDDLDVTVGAFSRETNKYLSGGTLTLTLKNKSDKRSTFTVEIEAVTSSGERITTATEYAAKLGPGQSVEDELRFMVSDDKDEDLSGATFNVISVTKS